MLAASAPSFARLLTHPVTGVALDLDRTVYSPPADLKRWVRLRNETCRWPGCNRSAISDDIDHATEWHDGGTTDATNLVCLCRIHHNIKSTGITREHLRPGDDVDWTTPWGRTITDPAPDTWAPTPPDPADDCPF